VKVDVPFLYGKIDAIIFSDWLDVMEEYFDRYGIFDIERLRFAKIKPIRLATKFWHTVMSHLKLMHQPLIDRWEVMKDRLKEKYLPSFHRTLLLDQLLDLR